MLQFARDAELAFVIAHELVHIVRNHAQLLGRYPIRRKDAEIAPGHRISKFDLGDGTWAMELGRRTRSVRMRLFGNDKFSLSAGRGIRQSGFRALCRDIRNR